MQDKVKRGGSLTVDSPACTARSAVAVLLGADFMGDQELLRCTLALDSAYIGANSVRLTFVWEKTRSAADESARAAFLSRVSVAHPFLANVCARVTARM